MTEQEAIRIMIGPTREEKFAVIRAQILEMVGKAFDDNKLEMSWDSNVPGVRRHHLSWVEYGPLDLKGYR